MITPQKLLLKSFKKNFSRNAIKVKNKYFSYKKLFNLANNLVYLLRKKNSRVVSIIEDKNILCYGSILSIFLDNKIFVPLNNKFSDKKNFDILISANVDTIFCGKKYYRNIVKLSKKIPKKLNIILLEENIFLKKDFKEIKDYFKSKANDITYILFTSGSTGNPKGVPITNRNLSTYIKNLKMRYKFNKNDKFSNNFDITFDLFLHDVFLSWSHGGCLYIPEKSDFFNPAFYIKKNKLTCWFSVPSLGNNMLRLKQLKKNNFPSLRYSAFCGEALPEEVVHSWNLSASNSIIENLYGPTEATLAVAGYRWKGRKSTKECINGIVPIGKIFRGNYILKSKHKMFELLLSGDQVFNGYLKDKNKNNEKFLSINGARYYKTGDFVKIKNNNLFYCGRRDRQIKINGFRIELQEIENIIKKEFKFNEVVVIGWPKLTFNTYESLIAFIKTKKNINSEKMIKKLSNSLSFNQMPKRVIGLKNFKYNLNEKIDYNYFLEYLKNENY